MDAAESNAVAGPGNGMDGTFVSPTSIVSLGSNYPVDFTSQPGTAFSSSFLNGGINVPFAGITYTNLFLSTVGSVAGIYQLSLTDLAANSPTLAGLITSAGSPLSYEIGSAIPEPSSNLLTAIGLGVVGLFYRRRRAVLA